eukprot:SAG31_NODE_2637_length_5336_cov_2.105977_8_plen_112_part_00
MVASKKVCILVSRSLLQVGLGVLANTVTPLLTAPVCCGSPELDYKRRLGQLIYARRDFLHLLGQHRGSFDKTLGNKGDSCTDNKDSGKFIGFMDGETIEAAALLGSAASTS